MSFEVIKKIKEELKASLDYCKINQYEAAEVLLRQSYKNFHSNFHTEDDCLARKFHKDVEYLLVKKEATNACVLSKLVFELSPEFRPAFINYLLCLFELKEFKELWEVYENRLDLFDSLIAFKRIFKNKSKWDGIEDLNNKTVLIHGEQGLGDQIQFIRYVQPLTEKYNCNLKLTCANVLVNLFDKLNVFEDILPREKVNSELDIDFDYYIPIMSLPYLLKKYNPNELSKCYINIEEKNNFGNSDLKIGLICQGDTRNDENEKRSISPNLFATIIKPGIKFYNLHHEKSFESEHITDLRINDFFDLAKAINGLDLIISVDTAVLHLAGAMGKETWGLLPHYIDWRWGLTGDQTAWYPSVKLFRQQKSGSWKNVFKEIRSSLDKKLSTHK